MTLIHPYDLFAILNKLTQKEIMDMECLEDGSTIVKGVHYKEDTAQEVTSEDGKAMAQTVASGLKQVVEAGGTLTADGKTLLPSGEIVAV